MIQIKGTSEMIILLPDKYEEDSDPKEITTEAYSGVIYREVKRIRKRININVVIDETEKTVLEALEAEGTVSFIDRQNKVYTGYIQNLKFQAIAGADGAYNTSFTFRGWV